MAAGEAISVVIPSHREGVRLVEAVRAARTALGEAEILVAAHGEPAAIRQVVEAEGTRWIESPRACRGHQLMLGASAAQGAVLLFLHADTRLPLDAARAVREAVGRERVAGGAFRLRFDREHPVLRLLASLSGSTLSTAFLGDQALFCTRAAYDAAGGFRPLPLFEDVDLAQRLARVGALVRLRPAVTTSGRRFSEHGPWRQLARNALLMLGYHAGVGPERLARWYEPPRGADGRRA